LESLGKNARSLLLQGKRNINVSNLQNYFRIQNVGNLLGVLSDCEELVGGFLQGMMGLDLKTGFNLHNDIK